MTISLTGVIGAGVVWEHPVEPGHAVRIMTGAPVPDTCDTGYHARTKWLAQENRKQRLLFKATINVAIILSLKVKSALREPL